MSIEKAKKKRAPNFTESEKDVFVEDLLPMFREFIECKKTDRMTNAEKAEKWQCLANEFNSKSTVHFRSVENLQNLWDNLKRAARAAAAQEKKEVYRTGGGEKKNAVPTSRDLKVLGLLGSSGSGMSNPYDSDSIVNVSNPMSDEASSSLDISQMDFGSVSMPLADESGLETNVLVVDGTTSNWSVITPRSLYTAKPSALKVTESPAVIPCTSDTKEKEEELIRKKSIEEESEWARVCKRRRPTLKVDESQQQQLLAAKLDLAVSTKTQLELKAQREEALFEIEKKKKELEAEMMALQVLKMKKELGTE